MLLPSPIIIKILIVLCWYFMMLPHHSLATSNGSIKINIGNLIHNIPTLITQIPPDRLHPIHIHLHMVLSVSMTRIKRGSSRLIYLRCILPIRFDTNLSFQAVTRILGVLLRAVPIALFQFDSSVEKLIQIWVNIN
jgi:hypothetical protein